MRAMIFTAALLVSGCANGTAISYDDKQCRALMPEAESAAAVDAALFQICAMAIIGVLPPYEVAGAVKAALTGEAAQDAESEDKDGDGPS